MYRTIIFILFYIANFLQAGAYGLTFMLPKLFGRFGANENVVGIMLFITALSTLFTVFYSGHFSDKFGRERTLGIACFFIATALVLYALATSANFLIILASIMLGIGWGTTYTLSSIILAHTTSIENRIFHFALLSITIMGGFGLTPILASVTNKVGFTLKEMFYSDAIICVFAGLIFLAISNKLRFYYKTIKHQNCSKLSLIVIMRILHSDARLPIIMVLIGASIFSGMNNFQTVFASERNLNYANYFLVYTMTVIISRLILIRFKGGTNPYMIISILQSLMFVSIFLFLIINDNTILYSIVAFLFAVGYGGSYPLLVAMVTNDAEPTLIPQTLQLFSLFYFVGIFGFPLIIGLIIVKINTLVALFLVATLALIEVSMATYRGYNRAKKSTKY